MKKYFVILLIIILSLSGCSAKTSKTEIIEKNEVIEDADEQQSNTNEIKNSNDSIKNEEDTSKPEEVKNEEAEAPLENDENDTEENSTESEVVQAEVKAQSEQNTQADNITQETNVDDTSKENVEEENSVTLKIEGLAENQLSLTWDELKAMDDLIFEGDFYSLNSFGTTGYTHFKGINLWKLLESKAAISAEATKITVVAQDGYKMEFTIEQVKKQDYMDETNADNKYPMIIAWEENMEEYDSKEGAPFKLVVGQKEAGDVNKPQWVSNIDKIIIE